MTRIFFSKPQYLTGISSFYICFLCWHGLDGFTRAGQAIVSILIWFFWLDAILNTNHPVECTKWFLCGTSTSEISFDMVFTVGYPFKYQPLHSVGWVLFTQHLHICHLPWLKGAGNSVFVHDWYVFIHPMRKIGENWIWFRSHFHNLMNLASDLSSTSGKCPCPQCCIGQTIMEFVREPIGDSIFDLVGFNSLVTTII